MSDGISPKDINLDVNKLLRKSTQNKNPMFETNPNKYEMILKTQHILDKVIKEIDEFRNDYSNTHDIQLQIDRLAEIIHDLAITLKYKDR